MRRLSLVLLFALAACATVDTVATRQPTRWPRATEYDAVPPPAAVRLWQSTVLFDASVAWNGAVASNSAEEAAQEATRRATRPSQAPRVRSAPNPAPNQPAATQGSVWDRLAACESGGRWSIYNPPYEGGLQFMHSTWVGYGGRQFAEHAHQATREEQIIVAERVLAGQGWNAWPLCSRKIGAR